MDPEDKLEGGISLRGESNFQYFSRFGPEDFLTSDENNAEVYSKLQSTCPE